MDKIDGFVLIIFIVFIISGSLIITKEINEINEKYQQEIDEQTYLINYLNQTTNNIAKASLYKEEQLTKYIEEEQRLKQFYIKESKYYASLDNKLDMTPRWFDVKSFLKNNRVDKNIWNIDKYDCTAFSNDVIIDGLKNNIFMCIVEIEWKENGGHIIVAVNTSDKGLIYIEPQTDNVIDLHLGKDGHSGFPDKFVLSYDSCFERIIGD